MIGRPGSNLHIRRIALGRCGQLAAIGWAWRCHGKKHGDPVTCRASEAAHPTEHDNDEATSVAIEA
jgi:hypothetical protein